MSRFTWFSGRGPALTHDQQERLRHLPQAAALDERPLHEQRLVVLDLETSGLDMRNDVVLAIGAVVIEDGAIDFSQQFERTLRCTSRPLNDSVLIHGIAPSVVAAGDDPAEALLDFMEYLGDSPLLAFHAGFDQRMLARALKEFLGHRLQHNFLDAAELAPLLCPNANIRNGGLDDWIAHFNLQVQQRHHASADALATAELALILFSKARRQRIDSLAALERSLANRRRRQQGISL